MTSFHAHSLICHTSNPCPRALEIVVSAEFSESGQLCLRYLLTGDLKPIRFPSPQAASPADNLWQHTCCEAFIGVRGDAAYREFNFSPSSQWAAYRFNDYRVRDEHFQPPAFPQINCQQDDSRCELIALLPQLLLPDDAELQLGLTAVIETIDGSKSYWALSHDAAQPDFHLRASFALTLNKP
ncbi:MAG: DOMON-like domain-containing protein [Rhodocyclaceae bacterium]|nr:DOMON-like domain-containing protein [Rhodocyclaceae bacterium]